MLKKLLQKAEVKIQEEIERFGFIDDSDNADRFLDNLALELAKEEILKGNEDINFYYEKEYEIEELQEELLKMIKDEVMINYDSIGTTNERGDYSGCWYRDLKGLVNWADTWQENSLQEAYEEFINTYDVDITLKQFAEAYEVDLEDYLDRILEKLLGLAKVEIEKEMNRLGYIDDSDNADRFLDKLAKDLVEKELVKDLVEKELVPDGDLDLYYEKEIEELQEELLEVIKDKIMCRYYCFSTCDEYGVYKACYYEVDKEFNSWEEFYDYFELGE